MRAIRLCAIALWLGVSPAFAQLSSVLVVSGLSSPVAVVQDPTQANVLFVVEQGGRASESSATAPSSPRISWI